MRADLVVVFSCAALLRAALPGAAAGMEPLAVSIANAAGTPITCHAEVAHWFSADLGEVAPGAERPLDLWRDPATGAVATRNAGGEFLPVERAWCGLGGRAYETRWQITLNSAADAPAPAPQRLSCSVQDDRLACR